MVDCQPAAPLMKTTTELPTIVVQRRRLLMNPVFEVGQQPKMGRLFCDVLSDVEEYTNAHYTTDRKVVSTQFRNAPFSNTDDGAKHRGLSPPYLSIDLHLPLGKGVLSPQTLSIDLHLPLGKGVLSPQLID